MPSNPFPPELQSIIDELVAVGFGAQPALKPESSRALQAWAENDGFQDLIDTWNGELMALDLSYRPGALAILTVSTTKIVKKAK